MGGIAYVPKHEHEAMKAENERLQAERDQFERDAGRLRLAAYEATTNGRWTEGEQCGEWAISAEVYETLRDAIADEQSAPSNSVIPCAAGIRCNWPACPSDCMGRPGRVSEL